MSESSTSKGTGEKALSPAKANNDGAATTTTENPPSSEGSSIVNAATAAEDKVKVHFVAVGSAPIMKKTKFLIGASQRFSSVTAFLRKMLKLAGGGSSLFLYCNSAFVPGPDELVGDLRDCFHVGGELIIHYSLQEAWG